MTLKNIVIVNDWASIEGGAAMVAIQTAISLSEKYNVYFFSAVAPIDVQLVGKNNLSVICLDKFDVLHDPNRLRAIVKGLWDEKAAGEFRKILLGLNRDNTIIHFHTWTKALTASLFSVTAELDFRTVVTFHDFFVFCPNGGFYNYRKNEICTKRPMGLSCLMCNCDVRNYLQKMWRCIRMAFQNHALWNNKHLYFISISRLTYDVCVPLVGCNKNIYSLSDPVEIGTNEPNDLSKNSEYVFMGRLSPEKGVRLFCQAITDLKLKGVVLGDGYLREKLETEYPDIKFVGWAAGADKEYHLQRAKVFVFTSLCYETFGLSVAEAKSYGIPCVVPDRCAASEQIEDGKTGFVFKTGDLDSLKEAIHKCEHADLCQMQNNIVNTFDKSSWTMESHVKRLEKVYHQILNS